MTVYAVVDGDGLVVNVVVWDGDDPWSPPDGYTAVADGGYAIGGTLVDGVYTPPPDREPGDTAWVDQTGATTGLVLVDTTSQGWMVTVADDGSLVTTVTADPGPDAVQLGPYVLTVDVDGVLVTQEV